MNKLREFARWVKQWLRLRLYTFALWLLARIGPEVDAVDRFLRSKNDNREAAAAELYHRGFIVGMNSRGVPADLLIHGESALKNADWTELDTVARAASGGGFFMTRSVPIRPVSGRRKESNEHHNRIDPAGHHRNRHLVSRRQGR